MQPVFGVIQQIDEVSVIAFKQMDIYIHGGNVEKSPQRRSRPFAVLTYWEYASRVERAAAFPLTLPRTGRKFLNIPPQ